eukprot:UN00946
MWLCCFRSFKNCHDHQRVLVFLNHESIFKQKSYISTKSNRKCTHARHIRLSARSPVSRASYFFLAIARSLE